MVVSPRIESIRAEIPATRSLTYLNTGWQGPNPSSVIAAVRETFAWEAQGPTAPPANEKRLAIFRSVRRDLARLINATSEEITIQPSTSDGINIVVGGLGLKPGDEVITCSLEHPSVIVPYYFSRERFGADIKMVRLSARDSDSDVLARFEEAITARTRLLVLSHITYASGQLLPIAKVCRLAHAAGALVLLDAAQSVGQMPVDVRDLACDFVAFPGHKWLLGPAATGALYVRHDLIERLASPKVSHHASASYDLKGGFVAKEDAIEKLELATFSVPLLAGLSAAIGFIEGIGLDTIYDRNRQLARHATARLAPVPGIRFVSPANEEAVVSGLVSFSLPDVTPEVLTACLWERGRIVARTVPDARCTRLAIHVFNTEEEVDAVLEIVEDIARRGPPEGAFPSIKIESDTMNEL